MPSRGTAETIESRSEGSAQGYDLTRAGLRQRGVQLAKAGADDPQILAILMHETRGKYSVSDLKRGFASWQKMGLFDNARTAGAVQVLEVLHSVATDDANHVRDRCQAAIHLARQQAEAEKVDAEVKKLTKALKGMNPSERAAFIANLAEQVG